MIFDGRTGKIIIGGNEVQTGFSNLVGVTSPIQAQIDSKSDLQNPVFPESVTVQGDLFVVGSNVQVDNQTVTTEDNIITLNSGETGPGVTSGTSGIKIDRGSEPEYNILFVESSQELKIGTQGDTKSALRIQNSPQDDKFLKWDETSKSAVTTNIQENELPEVTIQDPVESDVQAQQGSFNLTFIINLILSNVKRLFSSKADKTININVGDGLFGGGNLTQSRTISLGVPSTITATSVNSSTTNTHNHMIETFNVTSANSISVTGGRVLGSALNISLDNNYGDIQTPFGTKSSNLFLASPAGASGIPVFRSIDPQDLPHASTVQRGALRLNDTLDSLSDSEALTAKQGKILNDTKAQVSVLINAGNGLIGGGDLSDSMTLSLGLPSTLTTTTTNASTPESHTHSIQSFNIESSHEISTIGGKVLGSELNISLSAGYGDIKNPYLDKQPLMVLASPTDITGLPEFRTLTHLDLPHATFTEPGISALENTLTSESDLKALTAAQGKILQDTKVSRNAHITPGTFTKITYDEKGLVTSGVSLSEADIPNLNTSKIQSGVLPVNRGGTGVNTSTGLSTGSVVLNVNPEIINLTTNGSDTTQNTLLYPLIIKRETTATPTVGIGVGESFVVQTGASTHRNAARIDVQSTNITPGQETFELNIKTSINGSVPQERVKVAGTGDVVVNKNIIFTPNHSQTLSVNGSMSFEYVSDTEVALKLRGSDGVIRSASIILS